MSPVEPVHGMTGKRNASKPESAKALSFLVARCKREDKAKWVRAANLKHATLTQWVIDALNRKAGN